MRGIPAQHGLKKGLVLAFAVAGGLSLAACSDIDSMFADEAAYDAPVVDPAAAPPPSAAAFNTVPGAAPVATITPITIDGGAERALLERGASLLAVGIRAIEGSFSRRDAVRLLSLDGRELGRGLTSLGSDELSQVLGQSSEAVRLRLGAVGDAVVHRDQLVLTTSQAPPQGPSMPL